MIIGRIFPVENRNTLGAARGFLGGLLEQGTADALFIPVEMEIGRRTHPDAIREQAGIARANPLLPVMTENAAVALRQAMRREHDARFIAVLRPCEVRAVIELAKRGEIEMDRLTLVGMDCLSTYTPEYVDATSAAHTDDPAWLTHEALRMASLGVIAPEGYRSACLLCDRPSADYQAVHIQIGLIGVNSTQHLLVLADNETDAHLGLEKLTERKATEREMGEREIVVQQVGKRRQEAARNELGTYGLADGHLGVVMGYLNKCTLCGKCLDACPICSQELREALKQGKPPFITEFISQSERLVSCSTCGMCQVTCPEGIPLCAISYALAQPIRDRMSYVPGRSTNEPLPWG
jgi:formate dehydrogenase subunit beta